MPDEIGAARAAGRVIDGLADQEKAIGKADAQSPERISYADLPDRSRKWPRPVRVIFIAGSAAALWGMIFAAFRAF